RVFLTLVFSDGFGRQKLIPATPETEPRVFSDRLLILSAQLHLKRGQQCIEETGGLGCGGYRGIDIYERGQRTLRRDVMIGKNGPDTAGWGQARVSVLHMDLLGQRQPVTKPGQEFFI